MKINLLTNKIIDSVESENYTDNNSVARVSVSGGEQENISMTVVVRNDAGAKLGIVSINIKDGKVEAAVEEFLG